jgi:hypothetical protein
MSSTKLLIGVALALLAVTGLAFAQFGPPGGGGPPGQGTGQMPQPPDQAQMRQMMMDRLKQALQSTDEEWKVLGPKLERVMTLSRDADAGRGGMFGGGNGGPMRGGPMTPPGGGSRSTATSVVAKAADALQQTLSNTDVTPDQIKAKLAALRAARQKVQQNLSNARQEVRQLVTQRQEAQLVLMGMLD